MYKGERENRSRKLTYERAYVSGVVATKFAHPIADFDPMGPDLINLMIFYSDFLMASEMNREIDAPQPIIQKKDLVESPKSPVAIYHHVGSEDPMGIDDSIGRKPIQDYMSKIFDSVRAMQEQIQVLQEQVATQQDCIGELRAAIEKETVILKAPGVPKTSKKRKDEGKEEGSQSYKKPCQISTAREQKAHPAQSKPTVAKGSTVGIVCHYCEKPGHKRIECRKMRWDKEHKVGPFRPAQNYNSVRQNKAQSSTAPPAPGEAFHTTGVLPGICCYFCTCQMGLTQGWNFGSSA